MRSESLRHLRVALLLVSLLVLGYFVVRYRDSFAALENLTAFEFAMLALLGLAMFVMQSWQFHLLVRSLDRNVRFLDLTAVNWVSTLYNHVLPASSGGIVVRAGLLRERYGLEWTRIGALMGAYYFLSYLGMAILLVAASVAAYPLHLVQARVVVASAGFLLLMLAGTAAALRLPLPEKPRRLSAFLRDVREGFHVFRGQPALLASVVLTQIAIVAVSGLKLGLAFDYLDAGVSLWRVLLVQILTTLSLVISITPGDLGIREGIIVAFSGFLERPRETVLFVTLVDRAATLLLVLVLGLLGKLWLLRKSH